MALVAQTVALDQASANGAQAAAALWFPPVWWGCGRARWSRRWDGAQDSGLQDWEGLHLRLEGQNLQPCGQGGCRPGGAGKRGVAGDRPALKITQGQGASERA